MQASHEAIGLIGYSQPLRGKPIESLPVAQVADYEEASPAVAPPAQVDGPAAAHTPRTQARRLHSASALWNFSNPIFHFYQECSLILPTGKWQ